MKIGAGGLQALISQEAVRGLDPVQNKTVSEKALLQSEDPNLRREIHALNKTIERMRKTAEAYNQPLTFEIKREGKLKIKMKDKRSGYGRDFTLEEAEAWLEEYRVAKGKRLDGYV